MCTEPCGSSPPTPDTGATVTPAVFSVFECPQLGMLATSVQPGPSGSDEPIMSSQSVILMLPLNLDSGIWVLGSRGIQPSGYLTQRLGTVSSGLDSTMTWEDSMGWAASTGARDPLLRHNLWQSQPCQAPCCTSCT